MDKKTLDKNKESVKDALNYAPMLVEKLMRFFYGEMYNSDNADICESHVDMIDTKKYLSDMLRNLPLPLHALIGMLVRANDGIIEFKHPYTYRVGSLPIKSVEYDDTYGTFVRFTDDDFVYLDQDFLDEEMRGLYDHIFNDVERNRLGMIKPCNETDVIKTAYIRSIKRTLRDLPLQHFCFDNGTMLDLFLWEDTVPHELVRIYISRDSDEVCIATTVNANEVHSDPLDYFGYDEVKAINDIFVTQLYSNEEE